MAETDKIIQIIEKQGNALKRRYGLRCLGVFGSTSRGEAAAESDVDVLAEFEEPSFDGYMDLKFQLEDMLERRVDLVLRDCLKPRLRDRILWETRYVA